MKRYKAAILVFCVMFLFSTCSASGGVKNDKVVNFKESKKHSSGTDDDLEISENRKKDLLKKLKNMTPEEYLDFALDIVSNERDAISAIFILKHGIDRYGKKMPAKSYSALGTYYASLGKLEKAIESWTRHFDLIFTFNQDMFEEDRITVYKRELTFYIFDRLTAYMRHGNIREYCIKQAKYILDNYSGYNVRIDQRVTYLLMKEEEKAESKKCERNRRIMLKKFFSNLTRLAINGTKQDVVTLFQKHTFDSLSAEDYTNSFFNLIVKYKIQHFTININSIVCIRSKSYCSVSFTIKNNNNENQKVKNGVDKILEAYWLYFIDDSFYFKKGHQSSLE